MSIPHSRAHATIQSILPLFPSVHWLTRDGEHASVPILNIATIESGERGIQAALVEAWANGGTHMQIRFTDGNRRTVERVRLV